MIQAVEYVDEQGRSHFGRWFVRLDAIAAVKIRACVLRLEEGNFSKVEGVGEGVFEYKINFGPGYRFYFGKDGEELVILLNGGHKKTQKGDIKEAKKLWQNYKSRKRKELNKCH
jgi:putative addiction module killer protein